MSICWTNRMHSFDLFDDFNKYIRKLLLIWLSIYYLLLQRERRMDSMLDKSYACC